MYPAEFCQNIHKLPRSILSPNFYGGETMCYMYAAPKDQLSFIQENMHAGYMHTGDVTDTVEQSIHIQIYEPIKNPNRAVFDISPFPDQWSAEELDDWIDKEFFYTFVYGTAGQRLTLNGLQGVLIHFKMVYTKKIDPESLWNLVGVFPKYILVSELSIANTEILGGRNLGDYEFNNIEIRPLDTKKTIITEKRDVTIISTLGVLGGIVGILLATKALLFGARPKEPWGAFHRFSFRSSWKQNRSKKLKEYFLIPGIDNVPFVTPLHQRFSHIYALNEYDNYTASSSSRSFNEERLDFLGEGDTDRPIGSFSTNNKIDKESNSESRDSFYDLQERLEQLEGRNQILELVLKAYYIDDRIFREIHEITKTEASSESNIEREPLSEELTIIKGKQI